MTGEEYKKCVCCGNLIEGRMLMWGQKTYCDRLDCMAEAFRERGVLFERLLDEYGQKEAEDTLVECMHDADKWLLDMAEMEGMVVA